MLDDSFYKNREQTFIKHVILDSYLDRFAHIIGSSWPSLTYVDCFSGPWQQESESFEDTSFGIALKQLRSARGHLKDLLGKEPRIRCFFLERDPGAFAKLETFVEDVSDVEFCLKKGKFEDSIEDILEFVRQDKSTFSFIFVDPTGWNGVALETLKPLLKLEPGEVLVNFMTSHIRRFVESSEESTRESFKNLFATDEYLSPLKDVQNPMDREDVIVDLYCNQMAKLGRFKFVSKAIILDPAKDATHYHLIYASRHPKGLVEFKRVEQKAMKIMEEKRLSRIGIESEPESFLFDIGDYQTAPPTHYEFLRDRYRKAAYSEVVSMLNERREVPYDEAWAATVQHPLSWEKDLKGWIKQWRGSLDLKRMREGQRVPQIDQGIVLSLKGDATLS